ncbi:GNAT family N-acetyltransferase [uncultured Acetatifactor sp.]|uniref:GNAT family N-acetyltransferase n=1 Tax=uncultured Acetatifactor sp. TaxID=1671927 RepID=UPI002621D319|nr:GNAT family N-acetyltransferase [uncultured Acetatifactor sp.]
MLIEPREMTFPSGEHVTIRSAAAEDAESLCAHRTITLAETYFMSRYPEECIYDIDVMRARLTEIAESPKCFMVTAFLEGRVIADLGVSYVRSYLKYCHRAYLGVSIQQSYCNLGLGGIMLEIAIEQCRKNGFEQLELGTFEDNARALHLYEKHGFQRYGVQPRAFKLKDGTYRDEAIMVKML